MVTRRDATAPRGASVVVVGGGVTGLSAAWWLARGGGDVLVLEKGVVWEASGRNGGGCSHHHSPLFAEEQRLWPLMDDLLGYPTEFRPCRVRIALDESQMAYFDVGIGNAARQGFRAERLD